MERYETRLRRNKQFDHLTVLFYFTFQFLATVFVIVNLFGQLGGCVMVMGRLKVEIACGLLFFIVVLQVSVLCAH